MKRDILEKNISPFLLAIVVRIVFVAVGRFIDRSLFPLQYTDIDYHIYTDAANCILQGQSPYERPTYRYPPALALLMLPNILLHPVVGKVIFSLFDVACMYEIYLLQALCKPELTHSELKKESRFWLFAMALNPVSICICTRGSSDSIHTYFLLLALRLLLTQKTYLASVTYTIAVYLRIFPIIYLPAIAVYLFAKPTTPTHRNDLAITRALTFAALTLSLLGTCMLASFAVYGQDYLYGAVGHHVVRADHRHNFSPYFYPLYLLGAGSSDLGESQGYSVGSLIVALFPLLIQLCVLLASTYVYAADNLPFCWYLATHMFVAFNKVQTAQYVLWYLPYIPLVLRRQDMRISMPSQWRSLQLPQSLHFAGSLCLAACGFWLYKAYGLEFAGSGGYEYVWVASLIYLCMNVYVAVHMICVEHAHSKNRAPRRNDVAGVIDTVAEEVKER
eukprot:gene29013-35018_t